MTIISLRDYMAQPTITRAIALREKLLIGEFNILYTRDVLLTAKRLKTMTCTISYCLSTASLLKHRKIQALMHFN